MVLLKGLPLAYNRDLQEDKPAVFDAFDTVQSCLELAIPIVRDSQLKRESIESRLDRGYLDATTLMEYLIKTGMPQRRAHHAVGALVRRAMGEGKRLADLPLEAFQEMDSRLDESIYEVLGVEKAVQSFVSYGSTAPQRVAEQVRVWKERLEREPEYDMSCTTGV